MKNWIVSLGLMVAFQVQAQIDITGYVFESGNRGYISQAQVSLSNEAETEFYCQVLTDEAGGYKFTVARVGTYLLHVEKLPYFDYSEVIRISESEDKSIYLKHEIRRNPGYVFEITLAEKDPTPESPRDALKGALVEVYNNTQKREELVIENLETPDFKIDLVKGNHYTILIRKSGFLSKRMEAFVDVEGCILCFEGIGRVTPGVSDNLTEGNTTGVLLANVEMDRYFQGKVIGLNNIYYEFGKSEITESAADELNKVADFLKDNPVISVELGSHTDSRGGADANLKLSEQRARAAVEYLVNQGGVAKERISAKGYGEMQLTNNCGDDSDCTEEEHQLNRRTELKVVDIVAQSGYKMLRQMKADELMEEILADLDNAGQIKVGEGEQLEDVLTKTQGQTTFLEKPSDSVDKVEIEKSKQVINEANAKNNGIEENENPELEGATKELASTKVENSNIDNVELAVKDTTFGKMSSEEEIEKWIRHGSSKPEVGAVESSDSGLKRYGPSYTGYKVVVIFSRYELPKEHSLFSTYDDVDVYTTADDNKLYMLGSFDTRQGAEAYMHGSLRAPFPHSYVIGFEDGKRVY